MNDVDNTNGDTAPLALNASPDGTEGSSHGKKNALVGVGAVAIAAVIVIAVYGVFFYEKNVNFVIPAVPYHGYYNHFHDAPASSVTATLMVAQTYSDTFSTPTPMQLMERMYHRPGTLYPTEEFIDDLQFFGYDVTRLDAKGGKALRDVKKFVNPDTATPVLALMRYTSEQDTESITDWAVVIGVLDDTDEVVLHDFFYGSSYVMSQQQFEDTVAWENILVLTPTGGEPSAADGASQAAPLNRLSVMDAAAPLLLERAIFLVIYPSDVEGSLDTLERIAEDPAFDDFHPGFRVTILQNIAAHHIRLGQPEEAIRLIEEQVLPINSDLAANYDGWQIAPRESYPSLREDRFASPYVILGNAYAALGDAERAQDLYDEAFSLQPDYEAEIEFLGAEFLYPSTEL